MSEFDGIRAIVTGGASGIGLAAASLLASRGASVVCLDLNPSVAAPLTGIKTDVRDDAAVRAAVTSAAARLGGIDVVINNAGIGAQGTVEDNDDAEWARVFDVNVQGMVRVTRAALPHLRESSHAAIVNTCSIAATAGLPQRALYSATKGAVLSLTLAMAADHLPEGIRVNCVNPGTADTPWVGRLLSKAADPAAERAALEARQPSGRLISADEVAGAIVYLASPLSSGTTGTALAVDGGMHGLRLRKE
ncbi:SDR family NAD(P)-dependent oxidoreductase [Actinoplanes sp. NPDC051343]|uniref:SDR family NAD(P)-dependent oxidoreductase n=1 Tax=Actinoplanes sp. NPDC051343 TaxID=3363906 RepID=UPI00379E87E1